MSLERDVRGSSCLVTSDLFNQLAVSKNLFPNNIAGRLPSKGGNERLRRERQGGPR